MTIDSGGIWWSAILGAVGGFALGWLQDSGLEFPSLVWNQTPRFLKLGVVGPIGVGALAAVISYLINLPKDFAPFIVLGLTSGLGGSGILKGYVNGRKALNAEANRQALRSGIEGVMVRASGPQPFTPLDVRDELQAVLEDDTRRTRASWMAF
jgi:hypothetical protein